MLVFGYTQPRDSAIHNYVTNVSLNHVSRFHCMYISVYNSHLYTYKGVLANVVYHILLYLIR